MSNGNGTQPTSRPPDGIPYEVKRYALDANVVPPYKLDKE
jgi:hypothetical protein